MKATMLASTGVVALAAGAWWAWPEAEADPCGYIRSQSAAFANQRPELRWKLHVA